MSKTQSLAGTVKWFDEKKGYGFISGDDGKDYFVYYKNIAGNGFKTLQEGQKVVFNETKTAKGLNAVDVKVK